MKVIITVREGFIGRAFSLALQKRGIEIRCIVMEAPRIQLSL